eukprot:c7239_g1_i2.p1 GENE.c7239_g1_i2~~c7239_g1_i2.p1  ORF type:complete len:673 (+),score=212.04 c7239_g1_i2:46-2064(+)
MTKKKKGNKAKNPNQTAKKAERNEERKTQKMLKESGEEDIEKILAALELEQKQKTAVNERVMEAPPSARCNFSMVLHPHSPELILFGGERFNGDKTIFFQDLMFYHIDKNEWRIVDSPTTPPPRSSHQMVALPSHATHPNGCVLLFGGEFASVSQSQFYHYRDLWKLDLVANTWLKIEEPKGPSPRSGHRMVNQKHKLIVFGGFHDNLKSCEYFNDTHIFDLDTYHWSKVPIPPNQPVPPARSGHQMMAYNNNIFVFGGYSKVKPDHPPASSSSGKKGNTKPSQKEAAFALTEKGIEHSDLWCLDTTTWRWSQCKTPGFQPSPRSGFSMVCQAPKKRCLFFGGVHDVENDDEFGTSVFYDDLFEFNLETLRWRQLTLRKSKAKGKSRRKRNAPNQTANQSNVHEPDEEDAEMEVDEEEESDNGGDEESSGAHTNVQSQQPIPQQPLPVDVSVEAKPNWPVRRMNCQMAINGNKLFLFGGVLEANEREITLSDLWSIDVNKMDEWHCVIAMDITSQEWIDEKEHSDSDSDSSGRSGSDGSGSDSEGSGDDESDEEESKTVAKKSTTASKPHSRQALKKQLLEQDEYTPRPFEPLKDFFARTGDYWAKQAFDVTQKTGKALRKDGFELAQDRFAEMRATLELIEAEELAAQKEEEERRLEESKHKDKHKSASRR